MHVVLDSSTGGTPTIERLNDDSSPCVHSIKVTIPAACTDAQLTVTPEPGFEGILYKPDINGTGSVAATIYVTTDASEPAQTITGSITDSEANLLVAFAKLVLVLSTGNTLSYMHFREEQQSLVR